LQATVITDHHPHLLLTDPVSQPLLQLEPLLCPSIKHDSGVFLWWNHLDPLTEPLSHSPSDPAINKSCQPLGRTLPGHKPACPWCSSDRLWPSLEEKFWGTFSHSLGSQHRLGRHPRINNGITVSPRGAGLQIRTDGLLTEGFQIKQLHFVQYTLANLLVTACLPRNPYCNLVACENYDVHKSGGAW
jgi:hypothetical protein